MGENEEFKSSNQQKYKKDQKFSFEKNKDIDENEVLKGNLEIKFSDFDSQKGGVSPRLLFKKRKNEDSTIFFKKDKNGEDFLTSNTKKEVKLNHAFEGFLDFVREIYFANDHSTSNETNNNHTNENKFKFTSLDLLLNPLRKSFPWETWSPYEIALFNCCICKFGTNFDLYLNIITTKTKEEIIDFYYTWKSSKYYKLWKNKKYKNRIKNSNDN